MADIIQNLAAQRYADMADKIKDIAPTPGQIRQELPEGGVSFGDLIKEGVEGAIQSQKKSEVASAQAVTGEADLNDVVEAITKAEVALDTVMAVRDRMLNAFQEIMRTQI